MDHSLRISGYFLALAWFLTGGPAASAPTRTWSDLRLPGNASVTSMLSVNVTLLAGTRPGHVYRSLNFGFDWSMVIPGAIAG